MTWNYRIMKDGYGWGLFEVYYDDDKVPSSSTVNPEFGYFETRQELVSALLHMVDATMQPDLTYIEGSGFSVLE